MAKSIMTNHINTPKCRLAFPQLTTPKKNDKGVDKYGCALIFPKSGSIDFLQALVEEIKAIVTDNGKKKIAMRNPIKDGDVPNGNGNITMGYEGNWYINCTSNYAIGMVDQRCQRILDEKKFYPGCYVIAQINAFWFDTGTNRGISFGISGIQFAGDGERLAGAAIDPTKAFTPIVTTEIRPGVVADL